MKKYKFTYQKSGVNINASNQFIKYISKLTKKGNSKNKFKNIGSFGSINEIPKKFKNPLLVSSTDGVGTKLEIANILNKFDTIGIDLVAMCVNDLIVQGAKPLFFLDYIAVGKLNLPKTKTLTKIIDNDIPKLKKYIEIFCIKLFPLSINAAKQNGQIIFSQHPA